MTRFDGRLASFALLAVSTFTLPALGQQQVPAAPPEAPTAPAPAQAPMFPPVNQKNFTSASPTAEQVNAFLHASWGYDVNRVWQVAAVGKTMVPGLSKVVVYVGDKTGKEKPGAFSFFALPDGKHIIAGEDVYPFGANPYAEYRAKIQAEANGPYKGAVSKDLELVEFADFQCPHCKEAQPNMEKLAQDFPKARIIFVNYPLETIHPQAKLAAEYAVCAGKLGGSTAFFTFAGAAFDGQEGLTSADGAQLTLNSAVTKAGLDPQKVAACAAAPETSAEVEKQVKLAEDLNIHQTPTLVINGRQVNANMTYDELKKIIEFQMSMDSIK